jgi:hypothetical protein
MADISNLDRVKLENILGMKTGYVLRYSDRTFRDIVIKTTNSRRAIVF